MTIKTLLGERRRELAAERERRAFTDEIAAADDCVLAADETPNAATTKKLDNAIETLRAHVARRVIAADGATDGLPLDSTIVDGRTVAEVCADVLAVFREVKTRTDDVVQYRGWAEGAKERLAEAQERWIAPLEHELDVYQREHETAIARLADAEKRLAELKRKYS